MLVSLTQKEKRMGLRLFCVCLRFVFVYVIDVNFVLKLTHEGDPGKDSEIKRPNYLLLLGGGPGQVVYIERVLLTLSSEPFVTVKVAVVEG